MNIHQTNASISASDAIAKTVVVGSCVQAHLGDTLCISPIPRLLVERGFRVFAEDAPNARAVFHHNPFVTGFSPVAGIPLLARSRGDGHVIQRVMQGLELPIETTPRPEIYLDDVERDWARQQRRSWPDGRPICLLSTGALTDRHNVNRLDWNSVGRRLSRDFVVVQAAQTEAAVEAAMAYRSLTTRQYMALVSVADCFVGGTSGGSHVAAAFGVPALIIAWRSLLQHLRFPFAGRDVRAAFLYPQHWFIAAEDLTADHFAHEALEHAIGQLIQGDRAGRVTAIGNHPLYAAGIVCKPPHRASLSPRRKWTVLPGRYGERSAFAAISA